MLTLEPNQVRPKAQKLAAFEDVLFAIRPHVMLAVTLALQPQTADRTSLYGLAHCCRLHYRPVLPFLFVFVCLKIFIAQTVQHIYSVYRDTVQSCPCNQSD